MTIVTKPLTAVKEEKKEAEEALVDVKVEQPIEEADLQLESVAVTSRVRRLHQHNLAFLALCLGFISLIGFMAGVHLYKSMFMKRVFCNSYRVPLPLRNIKENSLIGGKFQNSFDGGLPRDPQVPEETLFALFNHHITDDDFKIFDDVNDFEFDVELDLEDNAMETFELPEVFSGRYLHDFMVNLTAIVDVVGRRCFLMKLDRNLIPKPRNILDYLNKERDGVYDLNYEEVKKSYIISGPRVETFDLSHGRFIPDACYDKRTFGLQEAESVLLESMDEEILENFEQVEHGISKREVALAHGEFGEFVGDRIIKYNIVNIDRV